MSTTCTVCGAVGAVIYSADGNSCKCDDKGTGNGPVVIVTPCIARFTLYQTR